MTLSRVMPSWAGAHVRSDRFCSSPPPGGRPRAARTAASWRAVSSSTFDSLEAMQRNEDRARSLRTARLRDLGADQHDVGEFELALAHLRVPELV